MMQASDDFYGPRRGEMADTGAYLGFLVGFLAGAPFGWRALMASFEDGGNATLGVTLFAVRLVVTGLATGALGHAAGALAGRLWERRHRKRMPVAKPEEGPDLATLTAAPPQETVSAVARAWQAQATRAAVLVKHLDAPDLRRVLPLATFDLATIGEQSVGRATLQPGWRWSAHVGPAVGMPACRTAHAGLVLSGAAEVRMEDGTTHALEAGALFHIPARSHDIFVVGDAPCVLLHLLGAERFAPVRSSSTRT